MSEYIFGNPLTVRNRNVDDRSILAKIAGDDVDENDQAASRLPVPSSSKLPKPGRSCLKPPTVITQIGKRRLSPEESTTKEPFNKKQKLSTENSPSAPKNALASKKPSLAADKKLAKNGALKSSKSTTSFGSSLFKTASCVSLQGQKVTVPNKPVIAKMTAKPMSVPTFTVTGPPLPASKPKRAPWDMKGRLQDMEEYMDLHKVQNANLQQQILESNSRIAQLEIVNTQLTGTVQQKEEQTSCATVKIEELQRQLKEVEKARQDEQSNHRKQFEELQYSMSLITRLKDDLESELKISKEEVISLKISLATSASARAGIEAELSATKVSLCQCESKIKDQNGEIIVLKKQIEECFQTIEEAKEKLRNEETIRRTLHNTIQELKGNIRVFGRVRPLVGDEMLGLENEFPLHMHFPDADHKVLELEKLSEVSPNESVASVRKGGNSKYEFQFDRVFDPSASQEEVFEEISQLVQSALDGYNVCIFAYGQTGSGKTYTMEGGGGGDNQNRGMIPRAVEKIFSTKENLMEKGWSYKVEVSFLEIYNETIRDLLGQKEDIKHEIRMIGPNTNEVYVTDLTCVVVDDENQVLELLKRASFNRSVAETKCNERSSRSHSIFRMKISGSNITTNESCVGLLNLIDLAGSERLKESGSQGQRLKETQSINKSLANLSNVIMALANKEAHVPYRNSKLTHLLQNCLGGSSKMLMFVNVSPREECFQETINSLRFATKVNECNIGTAQKKLK